MLLLAFLPAPAPLFYRTPTHHGTQPSRSGSSHADALGLSTVGASYTAMKVKHPTAATRIPLICRGVPARKPGQSACIGLTYPPSAFAVLSRDSLPPFGLAKAFLVNSMSTQRMAKMETFSWGGTGNDAVA